MPRVGQTLGLVSRISILEFIFRPLVKQTEMLQHV